MHLLLFSTPVLLTHYIVLAVPQIFPILPQWLLHFIRCHFTSHRHTFLRPSLAYCSSSFTATSPFCSAILFQTALLPPFTHIYRNWQDAENDHSKRNWWHVLGAGSSYSLQGKALPSLEVEHSFWWEWEAQGGGKEKHQALLLSIAPLLSRRGGFQEVSPMSNASIQIFAVIQTWVLALALQDVYFGASVPGTEFHDVKKALQRVVGCSQHPA